MLISKPKTVQKKKNSPQSLMNISAKILLSNIEIG